MCSVMISTETGEIGNKRTSGDYPNYSIIENGQNTEKRPEDLRKLAITHTPVKNYQLMLIWKSLQRVKIKKKKKISGKHNNSSIIRGSLNEFPDFFRIFTFIDSAHMKL